MKFKRYPDKCYAVIKGQKRGPVAHDKKTALERFKKSGLIDGARKDKTARVQSIAAHILAAQARRKPFKVTWREAVTMAAAIL